MVVMLDDGWLLPAEGTRFSQNQLTGAKTEISQLCDEPKFDNDITNKGWSAKHMANDHFPPVFGDCASQNCLNVIPVGEGL